MQRVFVVALTSLLLGCAGMEVVPVDQRSFSEVHDIQLTKKEIYDRSLEWMARTFVDSKAVIELKDPDTGKIIGKGRGEAVTNALGVSVPFGYTMMIDIKDNRYRTTYEGLTVGEVSAPAQTRTEIDSIKEQLRVVDQSLLKFLSDKSEKDW